MASFRFPPGKRPGAGANALARRFFLPACVALGGLAFAAGAASAAHSSEAEAQMRAECMALHEEMKASMMEGGTKMDQEKVSPKMTEKYRKCTEAMPEMREMCMEAMPEMREMCM